MNVADSQFTLTGFGDEIDPTLDEQLDVLEDLGIEHVELRNVDETNVLDLTDDELETIEHTLEERGFSISSIGSPIGKIGIEDEFDPHLTRFERAIEVAEYFDVEYIRLFSYYIPEDDDPADHREEVLRRMNAKTDLAEAAGVTLLHENEKRIYGDTPERCRDLLTSVDSPNFRAIFDPANFLEVGVQPYPDALLDLVEFVEYLHIKDATFGVEGDMKPAGEGDGRIVETLAALQRRGFEGFASLEPHLFHAGPKSGYSGPEGFRRAAEALIECIEAIDGDYS